MPIIWDDMLRTIPAHVLVDSELGQIVEPMVMIYTSDILFERKNKCIYISAFLIIFLLLFFRYGFMLKMWIVSLIL